jgi:hypothetical protein
MRPVTPTLHDGAVAITFAKDQPQYQQLPASVDGEGTVMTEWELSAEDLSKLLNGGRLRLWVCYTGVVQDPPVPLTPLAIEVIDVHEESIEERNTQSGQRSA